MSLLHNSLASRAHHMPLLCTGRGIICTLGDTVLPAGSNLGFQSSIFQIVSHTDLPGSFTLLLFYFLFDSLVVLFGRSWGFVLWGFVAIIKDFSSVREPPYVAQVGLKLTVLPQPSRCWDLGMSHDSCHPLLISSLLGASPTLADSSELANVTEESMSGSLMKHPNVSASMSVKPGCF